MMVANSVGDLQRWTAKHSNFEQIQASAVAWTVMCLAMSESVSGKSLR